MRIGVAVMVVLLALGIWVLREQTMSVHRDVRPDSTLTVRLIADTRSAGDPVDRLTRAHLDLCVAESIPGSRLVSMDEVPLDPQPSDTDRPLARQAYTARLRPGADAPDREQLHGCLEDLRVRHLRLEVTRMALRVDGQVVEQADT